MIRNEELVLDIEDENIPVGISHKIEGSSFSILSNVSRYSVQNGSAQKTVRFGTIISQKTA